MFSAGVYGEHTMTVNGEGKAPELSHVMALAAAFAVESEAQQIISEINTVISNSSAYLDENNVSEKSKQLLEDLITPVR